MTPFPKRRLLQGAAQVVREILSGTDLDPGPVFSRFELLGQLGKGSAAEVYRARDRHLKRMVALKVLRETPSAVLRERFHREAEAIAGISHPNLVALHDAGEEHGRMYLVLELVEGRSLAEVLGNRSVELRELVAILEKTARGVAAAHRQGIVHRDLKPANVLVTPAGEAKVTDFGLAHIMRSEPALTQQGQPLGTPLYMAPEQVRGSGASISPRADVYSLGAILYEILTGRPPHEGRTLPELYGRILDDDPSPPRKCAPQAPRALEAICQKALEKDPELRYSDALEMADELRRYLAGLSPRARLEGPFRRALRRICRRPPWWVALSGASAAALLLSLFARSNEEANVAKNLILQKLQCSEHTLEEWRRDKKEVADFSPAVVSEIADARQSLHAGHYADAAVCADRALLVTHLEVMIGRLDQMADHLGHQGRDVVPYRDISQQIRTLVRLRRREQYPEGVRGVEQGMQSLCSLFQKHMTSKVEQIQAGAERWKSAGREPFRVVRLMQEFEPMARAGRVFEADGILDRALHVLASP
jgi:serine/threonine protein kinase